MVDQPDDDRIGVTAARAARILGVSVKSLVAWERSGLVVPRSHRTLGDRHVRTYGVPELVELCIVRELQERGMTVRRIRTVVEAHRVEVDHPLRELRWAVDGRHIYVGFDDGHWVGGRSPRQGVLVDTIDLEMLRVRARRAAVERDPDLVGQIERRASTLGHKRVFAGTRTPVEAVRPYIDRRMSDQDILAAFPHLEPGDLAAARQELVGA